MNTTTAAVCLNAKMASMTPSPELMRLQMQQ